MDEMGSEPEDLPSSQSPLTHQQSDSEGSTSSFDLGPSVAGMVISATTKGIVRCRWSKCGLWFAHLDLLATHVTQVHAHSGPGGLFYCGWEGCSRGDRGFNARYKMLVHVRTHTNEKPHRCFKCNKSFSRAENLKIHARSHTGERPYVCPVIGCSKAYSNSSDRFKHTRTHSVGKPYICKVPGCPKRYTDPSSLRKHVKTYRHYPELEKSKEVPVQAMRGVKRDAGGVGKCDQEGGEELFINGQGTQYDLFRSWLNADLEVLSRSLWNPALQKTIYDGPSVKHCRNNSTSSEGTVDDQESPLDLTIHRASTRT